MAQLLSGRPPTDDSLTGAADAFQWVRPQLFAGRSAVLDGGAFPARITTRLVVNVSQSARVGREAYVGPWLS